MYIYIYMHDYINNCKHLTYVVCACTLRPLQTWSQLAMIGVDYNMSHECPSAGNKPGKTARKLVESLANGVSCQTFVFRS